MDASISHAASRYASLPTIHAAQADYSGSTEIGDIHVDGEAEHRVVVVIRAVMIGEWAMVILENLVGTVPSKGAAPAIFAVEDER